MPVPAAARLAESLGCAGFGVLFTALNQQAGGFPKTLFKLPTQTPNTFGLLWEEAHLLFSCEPGEEEKVPGAFLCDNSFCPGFLLAFPPFLT